jgi:ABC-type antimicrobial peptide transport system permease subunit
MLKYYLSLAFRGFRRHPLFSLINIAGLSIGISAALVIYLIVQYELDFGKVHGNTDRIYRVVSKLELPGLTIENSGVPMPTASAARNRIAGIETVSQFLTIYGIKVSIPNPQKNASTLIRKQNKIIFADSEYFNLFRYAWLAGSSAGLNAPHRVVLSDDRARLYFGNIPDRDVIGRTIIYDDTVNTTVAGVVKRFDRPTELMFEEFISLSTVTTTGLKEKWSWDEWGAVNTNSQMFVRLQPYADVAAVEIKLNKMRDGLRQKDFDNPTKDNTTHFLQRFYDIHFDTKFPGFNPMSGHKPTLYGLLAVGLFLLILGSINFINITTANASLRAKEIGIRKTLGSGRGSILKQVLFETFFMVLLSTAISIALIPWLLHVFKDFIRPEISFQSLITPHVALFLFLLVTIITLLSGFYPAMVLTKFRAISVMNNQLHQGTGQTQKAYVRKTLSILQFAIAQFLLIATLVVSRQIHYSLNKDLGFKKDAIISFSVYHNIFQEDQNDRRRFQLLKMLENVRGVNKISLAGTTPASENWMSLIFKFSEEGRPPFETNVEVKHADSNYFDLFGLKLVAGRIMVQSDTAREYVINEKYARLLGFNNPAYAIGHMLNGQRPIVGVVGDFHSRSTREAIIPLAITSASNSSFDFHLRLFPATKARPWHETLAEVRRAFKSVYPEDEFNYTFFDESIAAFYKNEQNVSRLLNWATGLCIVISCLGLLGLVVFVTNSRKKEIGIRKVLGASVISLVTMLSKYFVAVVLIAFLIALPIAWWAMHAWLQNFEYRAPLSWWVFVIAAAAMMLIALFILSVRTARTAMENPIKSLRIE